MSVACAPRARMAVNASWPGRVDERDRLAVALDLVRADVLGDPAGFARDDVRLADAVEEGGLPVVDVAHHGDDGRARHEEALVLLLFFFVTEQRLELALLLLARLHEEHLAAERLGDELDHLVGQRLRAGDHLARVEEDADEVGGVAVQLRGELLDRDAARHDDLALGDRRVERREHRGGRRPELLEVATTTLLAARAWATGASPTTGSATGSTATTGATTTTRATATGATGTATGSRAVAAARAHRCCGAGTRRGAGRRRCHQGAGHRHRRHRRARRCARRRWAAAARAVDPAAEGSACPWWR